MLSSKIPSRVLSPDQIRALSHEDLLSYALKHASSASDNQSPAQPAQHQTVNKRPERDGVIDTKSPRKRRKEFDMSRYGQRLVALQLTYQGWSYHGFASQVTSDNTVEHHLFAALLKTRLITSRGTCHYSRSGRTDVGVSAMGQVIGLRLRSNLVPPSSGSRELDYVRIINSALPDGIRVLSWTPVSEGGPIRVYDDDPASIRKYWKAVNAGTVKSDAHIRRPGEPFSARFDAVHRSYKYFFVRGELDISAMQRAAKYFEGNHDFRNFCRVDENVTNFERLMYEVQIRNAANDSCDEVADPYATCYIFVKGQAFLWHQVRCMAAVLFEVGMGREKPELVKRMLDDAKRTTGPFSNGRPHYRMASPTPLLLFECAYPKTVLWFPELHDSASFELVKGPTAFELADQKFALNFSEQNAKASILREFLDFNNTALSCTRPLNTSDNSLKRMNDVRHMPRSYRNFVDTSFAKHVPFEKRGRDISVEEKRARATRKNHLKRREKSDLTGQVT